ncbi:MAG: cupin domain-containing protein [Bacteroidia bacterium]
MRILLVIFLLNTTFAIAQKVSLNEYKSDADTTKNIVNRSLFSDSLSSSFYLIINYEVKSHKHLQHSEHVYIISGEGIMHLGDSVFNVKHGDFIFIPKNTPHRLKVTQKPLKCLSIQSPYFDGTDRVMLE